MFCCQNYVASQNDLGTFPSQLMSEVSVSIKMILLILRKVIKVGIQKSPFYKLEVLKLKSYGSPSLAQVTTELLCHLQRY